MPSEEYQFTKKWFNGVRPLWDDLIPQMNPTKILEIGSYEGASACYLIEKLAHHKKIEIHCVDSWEGGLEHKEGGFVQSNMPEVEKRFFHNIQVANSIVKDNAEIFVHKGYSDLILSGLLSNGKQSYFDFIYVDGSHQAPDVLFDAVASFRLLKANGFLVFDDYLWQETLPNGHDPIRSPKVAIDAFTNIYCKKIKIVRARLQQLYVQKLSD